MPTAILISVTKATQNKISFVLEIKHLELTSTHILQQLLKIILQKGDDALICKTYFPENIDY